MTGCAAILPARYGSTRLPGKPLLKETGKYLIQHVHEQVSSASRIDRILVATDDERIVKAVEEFGGKAVMTGDHPSGSDRVAEVAAKLTEEIILNVQGDEPEISAELLDDLVQLLQDDESAEIGTAAVPIKEEQDFASPHVVKVVLDGEGRALYFSRAPIPHGAKAGGDPAPLKHIGVYAYRRQTLLKLAGLDPVPLEGCEKLEQLRALHHGMTIKVLVHPEDHLGIDTREEYEAFKKRYKEKA
ncbi:MAG: 3-deoxy-manno-octulosonate cytidylyltransferase [Planctomycetota bacterium]|jgi:3-deoxy-manno-octulosonate cytidylyltransferase (CMP-KDO synthetase)